MRSGHGERCDVRCFLSTMLIPKFRGIQILDVMFDLLPFGYENIFGKDQSYFSYDYNLHISEEVTGWLRGRKTEQSGQSSIQHCLFLLGCQLLHF